MPLNTRQNTFVQEYLKTGNASASAMTAGYSSHTAYSHGQRLLKNVEIQKKIVEFKKDMENRTSITIESVVNQIHKIASGNATDRDKLKALDMLMKHLGGYITPELLIEKLDNEQMELLYNKILQKHHEQKKSTSA